MTWKQLTREQFERLMETVPGYERLEDVDFAEPILACRWFADEGKWPLVEMLLYRFRKPNVVGVSVSVKKSPEHWWTDKEGFPAELLGELADMLKEKA